LKIWQCRQMPGSTPNAPRDGGCVIVAQHVQYIGLYPRMEVSVNWIVANIKWIMLVSGFLTATMVYAAIAPDAALQSTFGETLDEPLAKIIVRNWGALIALVGAMLIYGAFVPPVRALVLIIAGISKAIFIGLLISQGSRYLSEQAGVAVAIDSVMIVLFAWYLWASPLRRAMPVSHNTSQK